MSERIRTSDLLLPKQVRCQAALRSAPRAEIVHHLLKRNRISWLTTGPLPVILRKIAEGLHGWSLGLASALMVEVIAQRCQ